MPVRNQLLEKSGVRTILVLIERGQSEPGYTDRSAVPCADQWTRRQGSDIYLRAAENRPLRLEAAWRDGVNVVAVRPVGWGQAHSANSAAVMNMDLEGVGHRLLSVLAVAGELGRRSSLSRVQKTGSSVYKPPRTGSGRRLLRSQLGPGSVPCNNPTRVVAKTVARLVWLVDRPLKEAAVRAREARVESRLSRRVFDRPRCRL